ncbi:ATP-dependent Clp protease ATP-binding subunit [Aureococcus anophagefferens]|uniref:ATP-dependent Clp protease ATP-binding subunit n=1 Tax=Aureococcus anophagefferens TaxID=44056 RepID=A0ABR1G1X5_AURAN
MHLTEDVVKRLCKTDPATVEHFHIHWVHVDRVRPTSLLRCQCLVSLCLSHADLLKIEGKVLGRCVNLWWVDLSHNRLAGDALATSGIDEFSALGALDLGHNALGPESLAPASEIEVVRLTLAGNAGLGAGDDSYRRTALQRAPAAWVLDDHFVTAAEAASAVEAHEAAAALERKTSPPASPTSPTILEKRTLATLGDGDWNEASAGDTATKKHLARHRRVLANQPARPFLRDQYRLKNLVVEYETRCAALKSWASAEPRDDRRTGPRRPPNTRRAELCGLPTRARLDACVLLWASLQFAPLPAAMYKEALTILLAPHAGVGAVGDVAALPPFVRSGLVALLREQNAADAEARPGELNDLERDLAAAVPAVAVCTRVCTDGGEPLGARLGLGDRRRLAAAARHAVILLSRAPSCPSLVTRQTSSKQQRAYDSIGHLLAAAGMTFDELDRDSDSAEANVDNPARPYARRWAPPEPPAALDASASASPSATIAEGDDDDATTASQRALVAGVTGPPADLHRLRRPRPGEHVEILENVFVILVDVAADGSRCRAAPYGGDAVLERGDLWWDPRGWWRHARAAAEQAELFRGARGRLHRARSAHRERRAAPAPEAAARRRRRDRDTRGSDTFNLTQLFDDAAAGIEDDPGTGSLQTQDFTNAAPFAEPGRLPLSRALPRRPSRKATATPSKRDAGPTSEYSVLGAEKNKNLEIRLGLGGATGTLRCTASTPLSRPLSLSTPNARRSFPQPDTPLSLGSVEPAKFDDVVA